MEALASGGCSSAGEDGASSAQTQADGLVPAAEGTTQYPLTLKSPYGESPLEKRPERIAVIGGGGEAEIALALGVSPVLVPQDVDSWGYLKPYGPQFAHAVTMSPWSDDNVETVAGQQPDLIVAPSFADIEKEYPRLAAVAPVVAPGIDSFDSWEQITRDLGQALELRTRAESVIEVTNAKGSAAEWLLRELGFTDQPNAGTLTQANGRGSVSLENLTHVDADVILAGQHGGRGSIEEAQTWLEDSAVYKALPAVKEYRVAQVPHEETSLPLSWAMSYLNPVTIPYAAGQLSDLADEALTNNEGH